MKVHLKTVYSTYEVDCDELRYRRLESTHDLTERQVEHEIDTSGWIAFLEILRVDGAVMFVYGYTKSGVAQGTLTSHVEHIVVPDGGEIAWKVVFGEPVV